MRVGLVHDGRARFELALAVHREALEQLSVRGRSHVREGRRRVAQIQEPATFGFLDPFRGVVVAAEQDALVLGEDLTHERLDHVASIAGAPALLDLDRHPLDALGDDRVQDRVRPRDRLAGTDGAELELVARERERARAVAIALVAWERRKRVHAQAQFLARGRGLRGTPFDETQDHVFELRTDEDRHDRRRCLVRAESVVVARRRDGRAQEVLVQIHRPHDRGQEHHEFQVVVRRVTRLEQVRTGVVRQRVVVVLARSVHARKRLLGEEAREPVPLGHLLQDFHRQHVVVGRDRHVLEDRRELELTGRDLVVTRLDRDTELPQLRLEVHHEREDALADRAEVVVLEFLSFRRLGTEQRTSRRDEVGPEDEELTLDEEVFLLGPARDVDFRDGALTDEVEQAHRDFRDRFARPQERRLHVQRFAGPARERGRNAQRRAVRRATQERGRSRIPGRVTARLERHADAARGERTRVGFALDQLFPRELEDRAPVARLREERIVLLRREPGHRLEPVREVRGAVLDGPILHRVRDGVGDPRIERLTLLDGPTQGCVHALRETRALRVITEDEAAEQFGQANAHRAAIRGGRVGRVRGNGTHGGVARVHRRGHGRGPLSGAGRRDVRAALRRSFERREPSGAERGTQADRTPAGLALFFLA